MNKHHVVFFTSLERDLAYMAVAIRSLVEHFSVPSKLDIHVLWYGLEAFQLARLWESLKDLECRVHSYDIGPLLEDRIDQPGFGYWAYLWLFEVLPDTAVSALYLDCDMLVYDDVTPLLETDLEDNLLAAAVDPGSRVLGNQANLERWARENQLEYRPDESPYVNAGMLFFNVHQWRQEGLLQFLDERFRNDYEALRFHDQDAINLFFGHRIKLVSVRWNLLEIFLFWDDWDFQIQQAVDHPTNYFKPGIKHFAGAAKPDTEFVRITDREHYYRYLDQTAWRGQRNPETITLRAKLIGELLEFRYVILRGFHQRALRDPWAGLLAILKRAPYIPLLYPLFYLRRLGLRVTRTLRRNQ